MKKSALYSSKYTVNIFFKLSPKEIKSIFKKENISYQCLKNNFNLTYTIIYSIYLYISQ